MVSDKHRVLVFGEKVFGSKKLKLAADYCNIELLSFPEEYDKLGRLADYNLVFLDYAAFWIEKALYIQQQDIFDKQMLDALENGTCFCILHYDDLVPREDQYDYNHGHMEKQDIESCNARQIGFRWIDRFAIRPFRQDLPIIHATIERNEFKTYQERWGASKLVFRPYGEHKLDDVIFSLSKDFALGFAIDVKRGRLLYLPCQRDFGRPQAIEQCLVQLINSVITYLTRSSAQVPAWATTPLFPTEAKLNDELLALKSQLESLEDSLKPFQTAKALAFLSEYAFEDGVPEFFRSQLGIPILRHETFKEDFWLLGSESEKIVIAETKSYSRGFKKSSIYDLYNHREAQKLDETFPAMLVVNAHMNANSWKEKLRPIDPQDCELATKNNVLVLRIEDLLFFWNAIVEGRHSVDEFISGVLNEHGWMEVKQDGQIAVHS